MLSTRRILLVLVLINVKIKKENISIPSQVKIWFQNRRMKWKRTKKGPKESKDGRGGAMNEDEEEEEDSKLEIDESDPEDNNNIQVDRGDEGLLVSEDTQQQSECEFYFLPDEIVEVST